MRFFRSAIVGVFLAIAGFVLTFALAPFFGSAVLAYVAPAGMLVPVIGPLIPSKVVYWLVPDGGAPAGALLVGVCALFFLDYCVWSGTFCLGLAQTRGDRFKVPYYRSVVIPWRDSQPRAGFRGPSTPRLLRGAKQ